MPFVILLFSACDDTTFHNSSLCFPVTGCPWELCEPNDTGVADFYRNKNTGEIVLEWTDEMIQSCFDTGF